MRPPSQGSFCRRGFVLLHQVPLAQKPEANERERMRFHLRPIGWPKDTVVILGAGSVHLRKGVDLFIACAKRVSEMEPRQRFRFVWIGDGFDPELDGAYSVYLEDQIDRSNLGEVFSIVGAISEIESAYLQSDILFLSSRLDPLPLVSMDALYHGRPLVCFESTTGIAEYLVDDPLASFGVVPLLDVEAAACRIFRLIEDRDFRLRVGEASRRVAKSRFSLKRYVEELDTSRDNVPRKRNRRRWIVWSLLNLISLILAFSNVRLARRTSVIRLRTISALIPAVSGLEKHSPDFIPESTQNTTKLDGRDPLAHYLDSGRPPGPWTFDVIRPGQEFRSCEISTDRVASCIFTIMTWLDEILDRLRRVDSRNGSPHKRDKSCGRRGGADLLQRLPQGKSGCPSL